MKIGCVYPQTELGGDPSALGQIACSLESQGFDHLLLYDHVLGASHADRDPPLQGPYDENDPFHDPLVAFGYLAGITKTLEFVTGVLVLPQRQTPIVAKQAVDVDLLSEGRLTLGVSVGWNPVEYEALGYDFTARGRRLDEQIPYLRRLWSGEVLDWTGQFERIDRAAIRPVPKRDIPIYCGGFANAAFQRAARLADGFIFGGQPASGLVVQWTSLQDMLLEQDRQIEGFGAHALIMDSRFSAQPVQEAADSIRVWQDAGGTHASIVCSGLGFTDPQQHLDHVNAVLARAR